MDGWDGWDKDISGVFFISLYRGRACLLIMLLLLLLLGPLFRRWGLGLSERCVCICLLSIELMDICLNN